MFLGTLKISWFLGLILTFQPLKRADSSSIQSLYKLIADHLNAACNTSIETEFWKIGIKKIDSNWL